MRRIFDDEQDAGNGTAVETSTAGTAASAAETSGDGPGSPSSRAWAYPAELGGPLRMGDDGLPVHPLPELPRERTGPFGVSIVAHALILALVILRTSWMATHSPPAPQPDPVLTVALQMPQPEPATAKPPIAPPVVPKTRPAPQPPEQESRPLQPPLAPKVLPPQASLPPPTRMGDPVPVPHYPVPGTVPPEETKTGKTGLPGEKLAEPPPVGSAQGTNDTDAGAGARTGPGAAGSGDEPPRTGGEVTGSDFGNIYVPRPRSGRGRQGSGESEGGGSRRGVDFRVSGGDLGDFSFEDKDYDWNDYRSQMYYAILRAWYNRLYLMTPHFERWSYLHGSSVLRGTVLIRFVIERSGAVSTIEVLEPSVMAPLDESAKGALKEVILPRLPDDFRKDREAVTGRFVMDIGDVGAFKQDLAWGKRLGEF